MPFRAFSFALSDLEGRLLGFALVCADARYASVVALGGNRFDRRHALPADWQAIEADLGRMPTSPLDRSSTVVRLLLDEGKQSSVNLVCVVARRRRAC